MQDKAVTAIGKLALQKTGDSEPYKLYVEDMFPGKNYDMILAVFKITSDDNGWSCSFVKADIEKVGTGNYQRYAYRKGAARGGDITFTTKFGDIEKKLRTLVDIQLKSLLQLCKLIQNELDTAVFSALSTCFKEEYASITKELQGIYSQLGKKEQQSSGFSICLIVNEVTKYLEDFTSIQQVILKNGTAGKSEKYGVKSEGVNNVCSICLEKKDTLHGFASPFKYATVDKPGMVSGFFDQKNNWKNYPICPACALEMEYGRKYIVQNMSRYFYGKSYYMIPKTILSRDAKQLEKVVKIIKELKYAQDSETASGKIRRSEDYIMQMIGREDNFFTLNLLFYEENPTTKAIKIKLMLEEIFPSRFRKLFVEAPAAINPHPLYQLALSNKGERYDLEFNFGILKSFFEEDFYEIVQKVFLGMPIAKELLFAKFMNVIRANYNKMQSSDGYVEITYLSVLKAHSTIHYLTFLGIIETNQNYTLMEDVSSGEKPEKKVSFDLAKLKQFIADNKGLLDEDYKVGVFSVGILVRLLLNIQNANLKNTPFEKKLKGYHLSPETLKSIYVEALEKISQYQNFYAYGNLREFINDYFILNAHQLPRIANNELSFYFVAGLEFGNRFKTEQES